MHEFEAFQWSKKHKLQEICRRKFLHNLILKYVQLHHNVATALIVRHFLGQSEVSAAWFTCQLLYLAVLLVHKNDDQSFLFLFNGVVVYTLRRSDSQYSTVAFQSINQTVSQVVSKTLSM